MTASFRARLIGAFAAIYLMWGGTFLAIRYAVAGIAPLMTMVLRCAGGAALLFALLAWRLPSRPSLAAMAPGLPETVVALLLTLAAALVAAYAVRWLSNALAGGQVLHYDISSTAMRSRDKVPV